jgi:hypothetical protein
MLVRDHWQVGNNPTNEAYPGNKFIAGKLGEKLQPMAWPKGYFLSRPTCKLAPYRVQLGDKTVFDQPLRPGHPIVRAYLKSFDYQLDTSGYFLVDEQGHTLNHIKPAQGELPIHDNVRYLPWLDSHIAITAYPHTTQVIQRNGAVQFYAAPALLKNWQDQYVGTGTGFMTSKGMVWNLLALTGFYLKQGLYLQRPDNSLLRIDDNEPSVWNVVSTDGCKLLEGRFPGDATRLRGYREHIQALNYIVINLCEEIKQ